MLDNVWKWLAYFAILGLILFVGWKQPLSYRFMSKAQIYAIEHPAAPPPPKATPPPQVVAAAAPTPTPVPWMWDPNRKTQLDRAPYNQNGYTGGSYLYARPTPYPR
jgi:hypothetical protein